MSLNKKNDFQYVATECHELRKKNPLKQCFTGTKREEKSL